MNTSRKCLLAIISFPFQNSVFKYLLHTGGFGGHMVGSSDSSSKDKWEHTETEIISIVKHMQTLALLCPSSSPSVITRENNEQVNSCFFECCSCILLGEVSQVCYENS